MKIRGHDADHLERVAVELDGAPNRFGVGRETASPQAVAQDYDMPLVGLVFIRKEIAADMRLHVQQSEKAGGDTNGFETLRLARAVQVHRGRRNGRNAFDALGLFPPFRDVVSRDWQHRIRVAKAGDVAVHRDQAIGISIGEWFQKNAVNDAEHGGVDANAKGQRKN